MLYKSVLAVVYYLQGASGLGDVRQAGYWLRSKAFQRVWLARLMPEQSVPVTMSNDHQQEGRGSIEDSVEGFMFGLPSNLMPSCYSSRLSPAMC